METFAYTQSGIGPVGRSYDVFRDGTLLLVHTPGHSHGLFSVMIRGATRYIVLGNDAAYLPQSFSEHKIPGFTVNDQLAAKALDWLIQCKNDPSCIGVFVNHDPSVKEQTLEVLYDQSPVSCIYIFSTVEGTYSLNKASDVQYPPDTEWAEEYLQMAQEVQSIRFVADNVL